VAPPPTPGRGDTTALAGFTVAITADRRRDEFAALLERRGARVVLAPALRIVPVADDTDLHARTAELAQRPPNTLFVSTGIGMRGWLEAAEGWGLADSLKASFRDSYVVARGPKARGAIRAAGLADHWSPESECCDEVLAHLLARGVAGQRIAVQLHGEERPEFVSALRDAGAEVVEVRAYRWEPPADPVPLQRLTEMILARLVDAVTFTSAPAVEALLRCAGPDEARVVDALRADVLAACVGSVTAGPLRRRGVSVLEPERARLGALAHALTDQLPRRAPVLSVAGATIARRGHAAVVDGVVRPIPHASMSILRMLVAANGRVVSRMDLLRALPRGADDEHAVEMAVARLRTALGGAQYVQTVTKRGYRLRVD
jgi:uroporphyrinogen-III synthase